MDVNRNVMDAPDHGGPEVFLGMPAGCGSPSDQTTVRRPVNDAIAETGKWACASGHPAGKRENVV
jgi:hypothetical protein